MSFFSIDMISRGYIVAVVMVSFIALIIGFITHMMIKQNKSISMITAALILITLIDAAVLLMCNNIEVPGTVVAMLAVPQFVGAKPYIVHIVLAVGCIIFVIYTTYKLHIKNRNAINVFSIKEAMETLPTGMAFMSQGVGLHLSNHIMHLLCRELTGKDLLVGHKFWQDIQDMKSDERCVINDTDPAFMLPDGRVWQFAKTLCPWYDGDYYEIKATDITELYNLSKNTEQLNEVLAKQQDRLKELTNIIEQNAQEQVAVNMKVNFHDNFGNLLALTKKTLRESPSLEQAKVLAGHWAGLTGIITELSNDRHHSPTLPQILDFGTKLGCEVIINGDLPEDEENKTTILLCINEALKNAYCHANAHKLTVDITQTQEQICVSIHNEDKNASPNITEGGGLTGLRQRIEQAGGTMEIVCEDGVTMYVQLGMRSKVDA